MNAPGREKQFENQTYVHLFFDSEEECMKSQPPDFFINCHQQIDFQEDNKVELMLSDIIWRGTYRVEKKTIILEFDDSYEVPNGELTFKIKNHNMLIRTDNNTTWRKMKGNSIWQKH